MILRAVVIGTGFIGPVHVEGLKRPGVEVVGMVGSTPSKSQAACERLHLSCVHESFAHSLQDTGVDAVHLATPNMLHDEQVKVVLAAGNFSASAQFTTFANGHTGNRSLTDLEP